jgi:succinate dehydrogenase/fumarate reductase-like Fe-S protein
MFFTGQLMRLQNCIECGCCVAACPVSSDADAFMGLPSWRR